MARFGQSGRSWSGAVRPDQTWLWDVSFGRNRSSLIILAKLTILVGRGVRPELLIEAPVGA